MTNRGLRRPPRLPGSVLRAFLALGIGGLAGCTTSHHGRVLQTDDGRLSVIGEADSLADARIAALDEANAFCARTHDTHPLFDSHALNEEAQSPGGFNDVPMLGDLLESDEQTQVLLGFRCAGREKAQS